MRISDWSSDVCSSDLRIIDLAHKDVVADPMGSIRRIYDRFALPFSDEHAARIRRFLAENPAASRLGKHRHSPEQFGIDAAEVHERSEEHTSELQSLMRISYAVFCLKKKKKIHNR